MIPSKQLERSRGRLLHDGEAVRLASVVQAVDGVGGVCDDFRGKLVLALTDLRLVLVTRALLAGRARLVAAWPAEEVRITVTRRKIGASLLHVVPADGRDLSFERIAGDGPRSWATYLFR